MTRWLFAQSLYTAAVNASLVTATVKAMITSSLIATLHERDTVLVVVMVSIWRRLMRRKRRQRIEPVHHALTFLQHLFPSCVSEEERKDLVHGIPKVKKKIRFLLSLNRLHPPTLPCSLSVILFSVLQV